MPNGWFDLTADEIASLARLEVKRQISEWKKAHPDVRLPLRLQQEEEAMKCKKM